MIRVLLPPHLRTLARVDREVEIEVPGRATLGAVLEDEALAGITRHAARALGLQDEHGLIAAGRPAHFVLWPVRHVAELAYWFGSKPDCTIVRQGRIVRTRRQGSH